MRAGFGLVPSRKRLRSSIAIPIQRMTIVQAFPRQQSAALQPKFPANHGPHLGSRYDVLDGRQHLGQVADNTFGGG